MLDERKVSKSLQRLENSKSTLNNALVLVGRCVDFHDSFVLILTLHERQQSALSHKNIENTVRQDFHGMVSKMDAQLQTLSLIKESQGKVLAWQDKVNLVSIQQRGQTDLMRKDLLNASRTAHKEHEKTREQITESNLKMIDAFCSKLDDHHRTMAKTPVAARRSNREICFIGECRETVLTPLLLVKDQVRRALLHFLSHNVGLVSSQHLYWLQSEFENLVSSAIQEVAALSPGSTATPFDQWNYSQGLIGFRETGVQPGAFISGRGCKLQDQSKTPRAGFEATMQRKRLYSHHESLKFSSPVGQLHIAVPRLHDLSRGTQGLEEASLYFHPSAGICLTSVAVRFVKFMEHGLEPRLYTQINTFKLVEDTCTHEDLIFHGKVEEIDTAFRRGIISPYDVDIEGRNICLLVSF